MIKTKSVVSGASRSSRQISITLTLLFRWVVIEKSSTTLDGKPLFSSLRIFRTLGEEEKKIIKFKNIYHTVCVYTKEHDSVALSDGLRKTTL